MRNDNLKTHYSAKELLDLSLSCLPNSVQGIIYQAKKNGWVTQKKSWQRWWKRICLGIFTARNSN